jgi:hypothetical protein
VTAESGGAAAQNRVQCLQALPVETHPGTVEKLRPGGTDYVGHLPGRLAHEELRRRIVAERERVERTGRGLQMTMRKVQIHGGGFQIAVPEQELDGPQIDARFQ